QDAGGAPRRRPLPRRSAGAGRDPGALRRRGDDAVTAPRGVAAAAVPPPLARLPEEWTARAQAIGGRPFHGAQIFRWIQARGVLDANAMSDLPKALRATLVEKEGLAEVCAITAERRAADDTRKLLVRFADGAT